MFKQTITITLFYPQADTSAWETEIDFLVYKLYGLSYDEVLVVDPGTGITREEYERG
ncbi:MAG: hypothetical protein IKO75_01525 [Bacteroidales bacterium]|nr:hypothetical protein [Bacteroidales bacterium]